MREDWGLPDKGMGGMERDAIQNPDWILTDPKNLIAVQTTRCDLFCAVPMIYTCIRTRVDVKMGVSKRAYDCPNFRSQNVKFD